ncbi:MAG: hypothetical protein V3V08_03750 [Nannocystaceae bacterium]
MTPRSSVRSKASPPRLAAGTSAHHETAAFWLGAAILPDGPHELLTGDEIALLSSMSRVGERARV